MPISIDASPKEIEWEIIVNLTFESVKRNRLTHTHTDALSKFKSMPKL